MIHHNLFIHIYQFIVQRSFAIAINIKLSEHRLARKPIKISESKTNPLAKLKKFLSNEVSVWRIYRSSFKLYTLWQRLNVNLCKFIYLKLNAQTCFNSSSSAIFDLFCCCNIVDSYNWYFQTSKYRWIIFIFEHIKDSSCFSNPV